MSPLLRPSRLAILAILVFASACASNAPRVADAIEAINSDVGASPASKFDRMAVVWNRALAAQLQDARAMSVPRLKDAFASTEVVTFYALLDPDADPQAWVGHLATIYRALDERHADESVHADALFNFLVAARKFEEAARLRDSTPSLAGRAVPHVLTASDFDPDAPAVMTLRDDGAWDVSNVSISKIGAIVRVGCPTSAEAVTKLREDEVLMGRLQRVGVVWLADAMAASDPESVGAWNARFPQQRLQVAWRTAAWKAVEFDSMPAYDFMREGRNVLRFDGWDALTTPSRIRDALDLVEADEPRG